MVSLGRMRIEDARTTKERQSGVALLRKAASLGEWAAPHFLGRVAEDECDYENMEKWYLLSVRHGDFTSAYRYAQFLLNKMSRRLNQKGVLVLRLALSRPATRDSSIYALLAKCYLSGEGVKKNRAMALKLLRRAARNDPESARLVKILMKRGTHSAARVT